MGDSLVLPTWAHVSQKRRAHIARVAQLVTQWADAIRVSADERERWQRAVGFHDALKDAPAAMLRSLAPEAWSSDSLRHGPAAAVVAAQHGERDEGVLDAVRYHSVGYANWDDAGRMLYLADFLEPGRTRPARDRDRLATEVPSNPGGVLREVAQQRIMLTLTKRHPLLPETVQFWNSLI